MRKAKRGKVAEKLTDAIYTVGLHMRKRQSGARLVRMNIDNLPSGSKNSKHIEKHILME